ncbi:MAG: hypothetical protein JRN35_09390 [Nitrososphaerota archaeon]|nr:hypothetical protein [Nitrososphaerota archaeon]
MPRVKVPRELILQFVEERQRVAGGITGEDVVRFARLHGLHRVSFQKRIDRLLAKDSRFRHVRYLGKRAPRFDLDDYTSLVELLQEAPLTPPITIVRNLNKARQARGLPPIPESTAYSVVQTYVIGLPTDRKDTLAWFTHVQLKVGQDYDVSRARASLETHFTWSDLAHGRGLSLTRMLERLPPAETLFRELYPGVSPYHWYETVLPRAPSLGGFLSSVMTERAPALVARFTFESQALWLSEAKDLTLDTLRLRRARLQRKLNARHLRQSDDLLWAWKDQASPLVDTLGTVPISESQRAFRQWRGEPESFGDRARVLLRMDPAIRQSYEKLHRALASLSRGFHPDEIQSHTGRSALLIQLAREELKWEEVPEENRTCLGKHRHLLKLADTSQETELRKTLLTDRLLDSLARGKITLSHSWRYQDLGKRMTGVVLPEEEREWPLSKARLEDLLSGGFKIDLSPIEELRVLPTLANEAEEEDGEYHAQFGYLEMAREVHEAVLEHHPDWFDLHRRQLEEVWQGSFRKEYTEKEFTERFLLAIGFLGRSLRVREDPVFLSLGHFLKRYATVESLETELSLYHDVLAKLTGRHLRALLVDTIGREWRSTHPQSTWHPRYQLQGFSDLRAIGEIRVPAYSMVISSQETEAMHAVELVARARRVVGDSVRLYGGNGHTVSRVSAGLLWSVFDVTSVGHIIHPPPPLAEGERERLRKNLPSLNKAILLLRQRPALGRLFSSRTHVYVDGVNLRPLVELLGCEVIRRVGDSGYDWTRAQPYIESSNRLKRMVTEAVGGTARLEFHRQNLALLAGEVVLAMGAVRACLHHEDASEISLATGLENFQPFKPT